MKKANKILWGLLLVALGILLALKALNIWNVDLLFDGWWTLFLILPAAIGLITEREKTGNLIVLALGVLLLLACRNVISFGFVWKLLLPIVVVIVGVQLLFGGLLGKHHEKKLAEIRAKAGKPRVSFALFSGNKLRMDGEVFEGAELCAVFGGIDCDLRQAIFTEDAEIKVTCLFGGVDILLPEDVNVHIETLSLFGGTSDKRKRLSTDKRATLYVSGLCLFGGVDVK